MRDLTLIGKTSVVNALVSSLFVHKMQILPKIPNELVHKFERLLEDFVWNGRKPKIIL